MDVLGLNTKNVARSEKGLCCTDKILVFDFFSKYLQQNKQHTNTNFPLSCMFVRVQTTNFVDESDNNKQKRVNLKRRQYRHVTFKRLLCKHKQILHQK